MQPTIGRRPMLKALATGSFVGVAGCTASGGGEETFRFSVPFFPSSLDPFQSGWRSREIGVLESLFEPNRDGGVDKQLVDEWSRSADDLTWEFKLHQDVTFHNGNDLDADAVASSLGRTFSNTDSRLSGLPVESVEVIDTQTVAITTEEPLASLPAQLTRPAAGIIHPDSMADDGSVERPISTGPFAIESWKPNNEVVVTRNDGYYGTTPEIERAVFEQVSDGQTRLLKLQNDELDLGKNLPNSAAAVIEEDASVDLHITDNVSEQILVFNTDRKPLDDVRVRRAVLYGIDRQAIVDSVLEGIGSPAHAPWDPESIKWANEELDPPTYDPDVAASLLADAGWVLKDDGGRYRDSEPLSLVLWTFPGRPNQPDMAEVMQAQLGEIGFDIEVRVTEWPTLDQAKSEGNYDMFFGYWGTYGYPPDPDSLTNFYDPEQNIIDSPYDNQQVVDLLEKGRTTFDIEEREKIYDKIQEIVMKEVPVGFLVRPSYVNGTQTDVKGYNPHPRIPKLELEQINTS